MNKLLIFILLVSFSAIVHSTPGSDLLAECSEAMKYFDDENASDVNENAAVSCVNYMIGFSHALRIRELYREDIACIPDESNGEQVLRIVVKYIQDHPELMHVKRSVLTAHALKIAFPCDK